MILLQATYIPTALPEVVFSQYLQKLPEANQKRIKAFLRQEDKTRALVGQIMIRNAILDKLNIPNSTIRFEYNAYGKPALPGYPEFHFNLSHAGDWIALAVDSQPIGVDVERIKDMDMDIAKRFFSKREYTDLMAKQPAQRISYFFDLWTLKESYIKAVGMGLSLPLDSFSMVFAEDEIRIIKEDARVWFFRQYPVASAYRFSVCAATDAFPADIVRKSADTLYSDFMQLQRLWEG